MAGIYIHIPFCRQACSYCNFHFATSLRHKEPMLEAISAELALRREYLQGEAVTTIYLGGGTPSLLTADEVSRLYGRILELYPAEYIEEFTMEANPDDLTRTYLRDLKRSPVSRLSIGVQSFHEADLRYMHRAHTAQQATYAIKAAQDAGFTNLSIDLIYGTPSLTDRLWKENLQQVGELQIPHLSAYALTVEERTPLYQAITHKKLAPVDGVQAAGQFEILMDQAPELGLEHYEISNLALPAQHARHNTNYWRGVPYLGVGPSAHSYDGGSRQWNVANNTQYIKSLLEDKSLPFERETLTTVQRINEYIMTSLRTMWGCSMSRIEALSDNTTARQVAERADTFRARGWTEVKDNTLYLTHAGKLFADKVAAELFVEERP